VTRDVIENQQEEYVRNFEQYIMDAVAYYKIKDAELGAGAILRDTANTNL
jgi:hypothetical protein